MFKKFTNFFEDEENDSSSNSIELVQFTTILSPLSPESKLPNDKDVVPGKVKNR